LATTGRACRLQDLEEQFAKVSGGLLLRLVRPGDAGQRHPTLEALRRRAEDVGSREIAALANKGELLGPVMTYNFSHSQRRHYERMPKFPDGMLVMGDALASFNPIYAQGMTVAACEALALRNAMIEAPVRRAARFFAAAAKIIDAPWQMAVGGDLALPQVPGPRPFPTRLINTYIARVQKTAVDDPVVAAAFVKVLHLLAPPPTLMAPSLIWRVMLHRQRPAPPKRGDLVVVGVVVGTLPDRAVKSGARR
jgi:2-polyprenyl-6-methoxyphenol hydroxylase-like FAD-dependent oxidoreductase